jgi:SAM-dependent methyltransferase
VHVDVEVDTGAVAERVRAFYERHPYPPPVDGLDGYRRAWQDPGRRRADHHLIWPARPYAQAETASVLVAGCGTSQAAKHAMRRPRARVTGIDFSATSVRHTEELKRRYDLRNLEVHQLAVERARELGATFDQIVCTGVLHHLADPDAGLAALRDVLAPDGAIHLMVYAPYGRTGIYMLQDLCRRLGLEASPGDIGDLVSFLEVVPRDHPLVPLLRTAPDFHEDSALADALLHPRDRAYSVPQLFELLGRAELTFGRWLHQAPYSPRCGAMDRLADGARARVADLPPFEQYAAVELLRGTMVRHSLVAYRDAARSAAQRIDFTGGAWRDHVPIRVPTAVCIRERLPPGAAAVLINTGHAPHTDIALPIDASELRSFEAIDGARTAGEIARTHGSIDRAGAFFERLYQHDQVVFDASG